MLNTSNLDLVGLSRNSVVVIIDRFNIIWAVECVRIRITCPRYVYPLEPHFCKVKPGYAGVYLFFLLSVHNIDYLLKRLPTMINVLSKNVKISKFLPMKLSFFPGENSLYFAWASVRKGKAIKQPN